MKTKIDKTQRMGRQRGGFGIQILYPGLSLPQSTDTGFATIGRIDHAKILPGTLIPMHPHIDDEILTYLRSGKVNHLDSEGISETISNHKLMLMNAGVSFFHEELVLEEGGILQGLQIFIRPEKASLQPKVQFLELDEVYSINQWRKIAGHKEDAPLTIRSRTQIWDLRLEKGKQIELPEPSDSDIAFLFYVFSGSVSLDGNIILKTGDSMLIEKENLQFSAIEISDIVLYATQTTSAHFDGGMYSGNQKLLVGLV
jgi:redox-sensitive bicupin YhaK (pirin superfamily)